MVYLFSRLFIKDYKNYSDSKVRKAYGTITGCVGIGLNILLFIGKYIAGTIIGSISITADAFNNLSDAGSSLISLLGFQLADKKPDKGHPFGHGRIEYLSGLIISFFILLMGYELGKSSFQKILSPEPIDKNIVAIIILIAAILVKIYMFIYNRLYGRKINSTAMSATAKDSFSDSIATTVVLIAIFVNIVTDVNIDGYAGLLVSLFIIYTGISSLKDTIDPLLGQPPEPEFVENIKNIVMSHSEILGIHDLVVHDYGPGRVMISLHGEVDEKGNISVLHDAIDCIERELCDKLGCEAVIHMDPICIDNEEVTRIRKYVEEKILQIDCNITVHDFRVVFGNTHTNVLFDAVIPHDCKLTSDKLKAQIEDIVQSMEGHYIPVVRIDQQYT